MSAEEKIEVLGGLLDFYSNKSNTHAGFVITGVFGMYALLVFFNDLPLLAFLLSYTALLIIGLYAFANFSYYGAHAHCIVRKLNAVLNEQLDVTENERKSMGRLVRVFYEYRTRTNRVWKYAIIGALWFFAAIIPLICKLFPLVCKVLFLIKPY